MLRLGRMLPVIILQEYHYEYEFFSGDGKSRFIPG